KCPSPTLTRLLKCVVVPPSFVHLDATRMISTAECSTKGLTFPSMHDCYLTCASSINNMYQSIQATFIPREIGYRDPINIPKCSSRIVPQQSLKNHQAAGVGIITLCEKAAALHEGGFACFDRITDFSDVEVGLSLIFFRNRGAALSSYVFQKLSTEFWTRYAFNNSFALLRSSQLLTNLQAAALHIATAFHEPIYRPDFPGKGG
ncbi:hypothetical protein DFJ58DRAFT_780165, partial [Suillus subalutaceus]|uniref:uncharacterized protein n=1 Tax=Suillus subalutaceus TaxID=48586 RepID=UPI001B879A02